MCQVWGDREGIRRKISGNCKYVSRILKEAGESYDYVYETSE